MAITLGLSKDELYEKFSLFSRYGNFNDNTPNGNLLNTFDYYLKHYTNIYPNLFDEFRFNKLVLYFYIGQTDNENFDFVEPIKLLLLYGADINIVDLNILKIHNEHVTIFTQIVHRIIKDLDDQVEGDEDIEANNRRQINEIYNLLKLFVFFGIDENLGNPSFNEFIDNYIQKTNVVRLYGYHKFLEIYDKVKNIKMFFHAKQRSNFAKVSLLPQNVLDSVFKHLDYDIPIELGKRLYNNTNMLSNLDIFAKYNPSETYPDYMYIKNKSIRDSLRDVSMRPSIQKFAKRTIKNRRKRNRF